MAKHLDLEEQEQLDQLKHFWKQYGNLITWALIVVLGAFAAWQGWQRWQQNQAAQASAMYDELDRMVQQADVAKVERAFGDMKERFAGTTYAAQGGLLAAKAFHDAGKTDQAKEALAWVAGKADDPAYQAVAKLRLAGLLAEAKAYDEALAQLQGSFPESFAALAADRKGDIHMLQGKSAEAKAAYQKAFDGLEARADYRRLVEIKLDALGAKAAPSTTAGAPAVAASEAK
jgi:predicted negative regulator of RcsB-dependent stress response